MLKPTQLLRAELSKTLNLPKSTFPPRPLPGKTAAYLAQCTDDLYSWQVTHRPADQPFVLHDGPPYANGSLHVGHALNKISKDIICRFQLSQGKRVHYIPGWDCHGLPIELKALQRQSPQKDAIAEAAHKRMKPLEVREAARQLATATIEEQKKGFRSWAIMGDWNRAYQTMEKGFELRQLKVFKAMVEKGLIYRQFKPVHWSPSSSTALAEAELEYNPQAVALAAFIKFKIVELSSSLQGHNEFGKLNNLSALIWTTTPWTLPANQAIAVNNRIQYSIIRLSRIEDPVIIATPLIDSIIQDAKVKKTDIEVIFDSLSGSDVVGCKYINPLKGRNATLQPIVPADFVKSDSGTGLVHMAPGHGFDDYKICTQIGIATLAPIDDQGRFTIDALPDEPERLAGKNILTEGNQAVLECFSELSEAKLGLSNAVWRTQNFIHKDAVDWRTKQPVIIRATAQWFADVDSIKPNALAAIEKVQFFPESSRMRLESFINGRSQWCISRQRVWGVPIPALFRTDDGSMEAIMTSSSVAHILQVIEERGTDAWWTDPEDDPAWIPSSLHGSYIRGKDTMDVWFDSGTTWTLLDQTEQSLPLADVCLEGTDQHRGWFQSLLLTHVSHQAAKLSNTLQPRAPYKELITHGFTLDEKGRKMSKSEGNVISPDEIINGTRLAPLKPRKTQKSVSNAPVYDAMGPDALRLWAASSDYTHDVIISNVVLQGVNNSLHKYRVTVKWLLGVLQDYNYSAKIQSFRYIDRLALHQLATASQAIHTAYCNHEHFKAINRLNKYVAADLSAFYFETAKDTLYTGDAKSRLAAQSTCFIILTELLAMLTPVTPLLVAESVDHASSTLRLSLSEATGVDDLFRRVWKPCENVDPSLTTQLAQINTIHDTIKVLQERARAAKKMGSGLECNVRLYFRPADLLSSNADVCERLASFFESVNEQHDLASIFVVSDLQVFKSPPPSEADAEKLGVWNFAAEATIDGVVITVLVLPPAEAKCPRCWRFAVPTSSPKDSVCPRCEGVLTEKQIA